MKLTTYPSLLPLTCCSWLTRSEREIKPVKLTTYLRMLMTGACLLVMGYVCIRACMAPLMPTKEVANSVFGKSCFLDGIQGARQVQFQITQPKHDVFFELDSQNLCPWRFLASSVGSLVHRRVSLTSSLLSLSLSAWEQRGGVI